MRSLTFLLSATFLVFRLVCAIPVPHIPDSHGIRPLRIRSRHTAIGSGDNDLDQLGFDNSDYIPSATDTPEKALEQNRPLPTLYLLSLQHSENVEERRPQHTSIPNIPVSAQAQGQEQEHSKSTEGATMVVGQTFEWIYALARAHPDLLVVAMMVAFMVIVVVTIEMRDRAIMETGTADLRLYVENLIRCRCAKSVRLEGEEKRLYAQVDGAQPKLEDTR